MQNFSSFNVFLYIYIDIYLYVSMFLPIRLLKFCLGVFVIFSVLNFRSVASFGQICFNCWKCPHFVVCFSICSPLNGFGVVLMFWLWLMLFLLLLFFLLSFCCLRSFFGFTALRSCWREILFVWQLRWTVWLVGRMCGAESGVSLQLTIDTQNDRVWT